MITNSPMKVLFTGYAPVHFACFKPLYQRFVKDSNVEMFVSGGLREKTDQGIEYDEKALYKQFAIPQNKILSVDQINEQDFDILFAGNTKMIKPRSVSLKIQIFHGVSFRNKAIRAENSGADFYFIVGPYMQSAFAQSGLLAQDDPRGLRIGFMKTDRLLNGELDRKQLLKAHGFAGDRPVILYAPTGQKHNSLEIMGEKVIENLAASDLYDILIKTHDHPKDTKVDWLARLGPLLNDHTKITRVPDVIPLLFLADLLITDASSVSNEYSLLDRPMVFLDVPKLIDKASKAKGSMVDLQTWGRKTGEIIKTPESIVETVEQSLADPNRFSDIRKAMAADIFYNPGFATDAAYNWLSQSVIATKAG